MCISKICLGFKALYKFLNRADQANYNVVYFIFCQTNCPPKFLTYIFIPAERPHMLSQKKHFNMC